MTISGFWAKIRNIKYRYQYIKNHIKFLISCYKTKTFDCLFLLDVEKAKMLEMKEYFRSISHIRDRDRIIKEMDICIKLIDIIREYQDQDNIYINIRNKSRFVKPEYFKFYDTYKDELRLIKAEHLYYEIRKKYTRTWWD